MSHALKRPHGGGEATVFEPERLTGDSAVGALVEARRRFEGILVIHMVLSMACQGVMGRVETMAIKAGLEGLQHELIKSDEGTAEFDLVRDLWQLSADRITVDDFLRRHGYHGPREGLVESTVWREDSQPVVELAATYRSRQGTEDVDQLVRRRRREHAVAVQRLEQVLGPIRSIPARALDPLCCARTDVARDRPCQHVAGHRRRARGVPRRRP